MTEPVRFRQWLVFDFAGDYRSSCRLEEEIVVAGLRMWPRVVGLGVRPIGRERSPGVLVVRAATEERLTRSLQREIRHARFRRRWAWNWARAVSRVWRTSLLVERASAPAPRSVLRRYVRGLIALQALLAAKMHIRTEDLVFAEAGQLPSRTVERAARELEASPVMPHYVRLHAGLLRLAAALGREARDQTLATRWFVRHRAYLESDGAHAAALESSRRARERALELLSQTGLAGVRAELDGLYDSRRQAVWRRHRAWQRLRPPASAEQEWTASRALVDYYVGEEELRRWLTLRALRNLRRDSTLRGIDVADLRLVDLLR